MQLPVSAKATPAHVIGHISSPWSRELLCWIVSSGLTCHFQNDLRLFVSFLLRLTSFRNPPEQDMQSSRYPAFSPLTGIGFRVIAHRNGIWLAHPSLNARNTLRLHDHDYVVDHLLERPVAGLGKSVFCSWQAAMTRRANSLSRGATEVWILMIDLEYSGLQGSFLKDTIDAHSFAVANDLPSLQFYGHRSGRLQGFPKEYLLLHGIPSEPVVGHISASGGFVEIPIHLGLLQVLRGLVREAQEDTEDALQKWVRNETYFRTGVFNDCLVNRLIRSMCIEAWDYDLDM